MLKFAWDSKDDQDNSKQTIKSIMNQTDSLVVIGYSFPNYNRSVDRELFGNYKNKEIILQTKEFDIIKERVQLITGSDQSWIKHISGYSQFHVPEDLL